MDRLEKVFAMIWVLWILGYVAVIGFVIWVIIAVLKHFGIV